MVHDIILLITQYGLLLVFLNVLIEQVGVPVPAMPTLMVASALAANGQLSLPGVVAAPPLAGAMGLRRSTFLLLDGFGSLLWITVAVVLGYAFASQIDVLLTALANAGAVALELLAALLALYIAIKWWQRQRLMHALRMARITVDELHLALAGSDAPVVDDVRSGPARARFQDHSRRVAG